MNVLAIVRKDDPGTADVHQDGVDWKAKRKKKKRALAPMVVRKYNDSEARDDHGRWSSGGDAEGRGGVRGATDWRGGHRPDETGPPASDLLQGDTIPSDVYDHPEFFTSFLPRLGYPTMLHETMATLNSARGKPNAMITIYRATPPEFKDDIQSGDWVSLSKGYAEQHAYSQGSAEAEWTVSEAKVRAKDVRFAGDDLMEFGYFGKDIVPPTKVHKAGPADEARDDHGRWSSGAAWRAALDESGTKRIGNWENSHYNFEGLRKDPATRRLMESAPAHEQPVVYRGTEKGAYTDGGWARPINDVYKEWTDKVGKTVSMPKLSSATADPQIAHSFGHIVFAIDHQGRARDIGNPLKEAVLIPGKYTVTRVDEPKQAEAHAAGFGGARYTSSSPHIVVHLSAVKPFKEGGSSPKATNGADDAEFMHGAMWHGSPNGEVGSKVAAYGIHVGTRQAAKEALEARIGKRADGKDWDGTQEYGKTLLAGYNVGYERGKDAHYPTGKAVYSDGTPVPMDAKPNLFPVRIVGTMSNTQQNPHEDFKANGYMHAQLKRGTAKRGYYYSEVGEDAGSVAAVVPSRTHLQTYDEYVRKGDIAKHPQWTHVAFAEPGAVGNNTHITREDRGHLPTSALSHLQGAEGEIPGEHRNKTGKTWEAFKADIKANGIQHPIFITVRHGEKPKLSEGNHRRDAAMELGLDKVPVQVRYFGHSERDGDIVQRLGITKMRKGDIAKHPFHGNQWIGGESGPEIDRPTSSPRTPAATPPPSSPSSPGNEIAGLEAGQSEEVDTPQQMSTLIADLAAMARDPKAKTIDLAKVTVPGTNLFTQGSLGIDRAQMPQMKGVPRPGSWAATHLMPDKRGEYDVGPQLIKNLQTRGIATTQVSVDASTLKATQSQLNGEEVAGIATALDSGVKMDGNIWISKDGYVIDGHHRWAAEAARSYEEGKPLMINAYRIDAPIKQILPIATKLASSLGIPQKGVDGAFPDPHMGEKPKTTAKDPALAALNQKNSIRDNVVSAGIKNGGFSWHPATGKEPTDGFMVGGVQKDVSIPLDNPDDPAQRAEVARAVVKYVRDNADVFRKNPSLYLGGWHNVNGKSFVIEPSEHVADEKQATTLGTQRNQISIWDVANTQEIPTGGTGEYREPTRKAGAGHTPGGRDRRGTSGVGGATGGRCLAPFRLAEHAPRSVALYGLDTDHGSRRRVSLFKAAHDVSQEARDDHGEWTAGAGSSSSITKPSKRVVAPLSTAVPGVHAQPHANTARVITGLGMTEFPDAFTGRMDAKAKKLGISVDSVTANYEKYFAQAKEKVSGKTPWSQRNWYHKLNGDITTLAQKLQVPPDTIGAAVSVMASHREWNKNLKDSTAIFNVVAENKPFTVSQKIIDSFTKHQMSGRIQHPERLLNSDGTPIKAGTMYPKTANPWIAVIAHPDIINAHVMGQTGVDPPARAVALAQNAYSDSKLGMEPKEAVQGVKLRSFYNNMVAPDDTRFATVDTWMYRAGVDPAQKFHTTYNGKLGDYTLAEYEKIYQKTGKDGKPAFKPDGSPHMLKRAPQNLFQASPGKIVVNKKPVFPSNVGLYPIFHEAINRGAALHHLTPHQYQAVVWYAVKDHWVPAEGGRNVDTKDYVDDE